MSCSFLVHYPKVTISGSINITYSPCLSILLWEKATLQVNICGLQLCLPNTTGLHWSHRPGEMSDSMSIGECLVVIPTLGYSKSFQFFSWRTLGKNKRRKTVRKTEQDQDGNWVFWGACHGGSVILGKKSWKNSIGICHNSSFKTERTLLELPEHDNLTEQWRRNLK